jgi:hypothetical protein
MKRLVFVMVFIYVVNIAGTAYADDPIGGLIDAIMKVYGLIKNICQIWII